MKTEDVFYTKTMAKVYADQGKLGQAAEIYRCLLKKEPDRQDLIDALAQIDRKRFDERSEGLSRLLGTWLELLLAHGRLQTLKKFQQQVKDI